MAVRLEPPEKVHGWVRSERPKKVTRRNIFDYMDGAGELYLAYSFVGLDVWKYEKRDEPEILLEVYDMGHPAEAFGVLSFELSGEEVGIGQKSLYGAGLLRFWKGRFFTRILAEAETPEVKQAVMTIGKSVAGELPAEGSPPRLVADLPETGLLPESVHYFHTKICLDYFYYLAENNILNLDKNTNAVMADYRTASGQVKLLAVRYDSETASLNAWTSFHASYLNQEAPKSGLIDSKQIEGEQWVCSWRKGDLLLFAFEGKARKDCEELLGAAASALKGG